MNIGLLSAISAAEDKPLPIPSSDRTIFICTTPRTGGHNLCSQLATVGLGHPTEFFGPQIAVPLLRRWTGENVTSISEVGTLAPTYGEHLLRLRSPHSVFSAKLFFGDIRFLRKCFSAERLQQATYLFLVRNDLVAQTISLLALLKTKRAFDSDEVVDFIDQIETIDAAIAERTLLWIIKQNCMWSHYLSNLPKVLWTDTEATLQPANGVAQNTAAAMSIAPQETTSNIERQRYQRDGELKRLLHEQFGQHLTRILEQHNQDFKPPQNARRVS